MLIFVLYKCDVGLNGVTWIHLALAIGHKMFVLTW